MATLSTPASLAGILWVDPNNGVVTFRASHACSAQLHTTRTTFSNRFEEESRSSRSRIAYYWRALCFSKAAHFLEGFYDNDPCTLPRCGRTRMRHAERLRREVHVNPSATIKRGPRGAKDDGKYPQCASMASSCCIDVEIWCNRSRTYGGTPFLHLHALAIVLSKRPPSFAPGPRHRPKAFHTARAGGCRPLEAFYPRRDSAPMRPPLPRYRRTTLPLRALPVVRLLPRVPGVWHLVRPPTSIFTSVCFPVSLWRSRTSASWSTASSWYFKKFIMFLTFLCWNRSRNWDPPDDTRSRRTWSVRIRSTFTTPSDWLMDHHQQQHRRAAGAGNGLHDLESGLRRKSYGWDVTP